MDINFELCNSTDFGKYLHKYMHVFINVVYSVFIV